MNFATLRFLTAPLSQRCCSARAGAYSGGRRSRLLALFLWCATLSLRYCGTIALCERLYKNFLRNADDMHVHKQTGSSSAPPWKALNMSDCRRPLGPVGHGRAIYPLKQFGWRSYPLGDAERTEALHRDSTNITQQ